MTGLPNNSPQVAPHVVAELTEKAPNRVRKKLDRAPQQALDWNWKLDDDAWEVDTNGEQVRLKVDSGVVVDPDAVSCSCLLSPRCFHTIACLSVLPLATDPILLLEAPTDDDATTTDSAVTSEDNENCDLENAEIEPVACDASQREAAQQVWSAAAAVLAGGARAAGAMQQAAMLRAAHECRLAGLYRLGNAGIRLVASVRQCRNNSDTFESDALMADLFELLHCSKHLQRDETVDAGWFGVARRKYTPKPFLKVHGLFCEPLVTRSGFSGVVSYFLGDDGEIYSVSNVRPGDSSRIRSAYKGGLDVGGVSASHREASRSALLMQHGSVSSDGRIGGGQKAKGVVQTSQGWAEPSIQQRFDVPLVDQITRVFDQLLLGEEQQRAGWDLLFLRGELLGGDGQSLVLQLGDQSVLRLACASFSDRMAFADNVQLLSGRRVHVLCIARLLPNELGVANLLALAPDSSRDPGEGDEDGRKTIGWSLPETWNHRVNAGLDALQGAYVPKNAGAVGGLGFAVGDDGLDPLRRRLRAVALGGRHGRSGERDAARDVARLRRDLLPTGADLLDSLVLSCAPSDVDQMGSRFPTDPKPLANAYLAAAVYERAARSRFLESCWRGLAGD